MPFVWSQHAAHIQSLFRPWQLGDGYTEAMIRAAETALRIDLPATLRSFYRDWGTRDDLTRACETLLRPHELFLRSDALIFCVENQAVFYWAIRRESLGQADPPVYFAYSDEESELNWELSHERLSDFFDALTYAHAFRGGAVHGGNSPRYGDDRRLALLEQHWRRVEINSVPWGIIPNAIARGWPLYVREGQAIDGHHQFWVAARTIDDLDEISRVLDITWERRW